MLDVACTEPDFCVAVGATGYPAGGSWSTLAERWDGVGWALDVTPDRTTAPPSATTNPEPLGTLVPSLVNNLEGVSCPRTGFCTAVGTTVVEGAAGGTLVEEYHG